MGHAGGVARAARRGPRARRAAADAGRGRAAAAAQRALRAHRGHARRHVRRHGPQRVGVRRSPVSVTYRFIWRDFVLTIDIGIYVFLLGWGRFGWLVHFIVLPVITEI